MRYARRNRILGIHNQGAKLTKDYRGYERERERERERGVNKSPFGAAELGRKERRKVANTRRNESVVSVSERNDHHRAKK